MQLLEGERLGLARALVYYFLNHVDLVVDLLDLERGHHLSPLDRQYVLKLVQQNVRLNYVKECHAS